MTRKPRFVLALSCFAMLALVAAGPAAAETDTAPDPAPAAVVTEPAADLFAGDGCAAAEAPAAEADLFTPAPTEKIVCEFCNLNGFPNCESKTGTSCNYPQPNRRCWINPPCACEWGICLCRSNGVWECFW